MDEIASPREKSLVEFTGASMLQGVAAVGAIALTIIGLVGIEPTLLLSIAAIVLGTALLISGGTVMARESKLFPSAEQSYSEEIIGGGMAIDSLAGLAGIVLGILALIGIYPRLLLPIAAITFGGAMLLASGSLARMGKLTLTGSVKRRQWSARQSMYVASGIDFVFGAGAVVLGILALSGHSGFLLTLVALLAIGCANLVTSMAFAEKATTALQ